MNRILSGIWCAAFAATFSAANVGHLDAAPFFLPGAKVAQQSDVIQVRDRLRWQGNSFRGSSLRYGRNWSGDGFRRGRNYGWDGYGGYRNYPRYRYDDDLWISGGALIVGALIASALANRNHYGGGYYRDNYATSGSGHIDWCRNRYRSYRVRDNSFQPYNGPRRPCNSPYR